METEDPPATAGSTVPLNVNQLKQQPVVRLHHGSLRGAMSELRPKELPQEVRWVMVPLLADRPEAMNQEVQAGHRAVKNRIIAQKEPHQAEDKCIIIFPFRVE